MLKTAKLQLNKPEATDIVNIDELNANMDVLDNEVTKLATQTVDGRLSATDKKKLDGIETGAQKNTVTSVAGKTGAVTLAGTDVPAATTSARGTVQLSAATNSTSTTLAATPSAVKVAYDKAVAAETKAGESGTGLESHLADGINHIRYGVDSGTANAKIVTLSPAQTSYADGMAIAFKNAVQNTGAVTINVNGLGAKSIKKSNGNALTPGNLKVGIPYTLRYNGKDFILQGEGGVGNAQPSDVRKDKTFTNDDGEQKGILVAYTAGETIKAQDLINRPYIGTSEIYSTDGGSFYNTEVATINGIEYGFAYSGSTRNSNIYCVEILTGKLIWRKNVKYEWKGRIAVYNNKLYVGWYDYDGALGFGGSNVGLETMNALTGATLKVSKASPQDGKATHIQDICLSDVDNTKVIIAIVDNYGSGSWLASFSIDGTFSAISDNLYTKYVDGTPSRIQSSGGYVYVAGEKGIYKFWIYDNGLIYMSKIQPISDSYGISGFSANNIGGVSYTLGGYDPYVYVLSSSLSQLTNMYIGDSNVFGLTIKGNLMCYATSTRLYTYRLYDDGKTRMSLGELSYPSDVTYSKCIGISENALVPPKYSTKNSPEVFTKTLKIQR